MSFLSLCENEQLIIYPASCFLSSLFVGESTGVNGLNVESQQPGEYSGDSKCLFILKSYINLIYLLFLYIFKNYSIYVPALIYDGIFHFIGEFSAFSCEWDLISLCVMRSAFC